MRNKKVKEMAVFALFIALIGIASFTPLGFIPFGAASVTIIHVFVLMMAFLTGTKGGVVAGFAFGAFSFFRALVSPVTPTDILFQNPLVSILPRVLFGLCAGLVSSHLNKKYGDSLGKKTVLIAVSACLLTLLHTCLTLPMMYLFAPTVDAFKNFWNEQSFFVFFWGVLVANGFLEILVAGVATPLCVVPLSKIMERN